MMRRPPRSTQSGSSAASDVYKGLLAVFAGAGVPGLAVEEAPLLIWRAGIWMAGDVLVFYTHLRAHETPEHLVCCLLLEKKKIFFITPSVCIICLTL